MKILIDDIQYSKYEELRLFSIRTEKFNNAYIFLFLTSGKVQQPDMDEGS